MTDDARTARLQALEAELLAMPPVAALGLRVASAADDDRLCLRAPLAANVNDKGCAFGGSLVSLMTLAGWGLIVRRLAEAGEDADVYVAASEVRYRAPLYAELAAVAEPAEGESWAAFLAALRDTGKARFAVAAHVPLPEGGVAAECLGRYTAVRRG
ncbi:MAG: YiiD C-terminal domain-containing protein [Xanthomonadales bacterium]|nr:YiiD C-terminal domain-containing protein [Xanthomonadales bacterium]